MGSSKNYNSIVFLTTLSVYLGLVLVGGTPMVSAQGISEKKIEVGYLDDEKILGEYVSIFQDLHISSKDLTVKFDKKLADGILKLICVHNINPDFTKCEPGSGVYSSKFDHPLEQLNKIFPQTLQKDEQQVGINLLFTPKNFSLKITLNQDSNEQAEQVSFLYNLELSRIKIQLVGNPQGVVYQNTEIFKENNQVFIVTRLPRGSLDALLAKTDAQ